MINHTLTELGATMTTAHPDRAAMTDEDLICAVMGNDNATATELELAQRLDSALVEISLLTRDSTGQVQH